MWVKMKSEKKKLHFVILNLIFIFIILEITIEL